MFRLMLNAFGRFKAAASKKVSDFLLLKFSSGQNVFSKQSSTFEIIGLANLLEILMTKKLYDIMSVNDDTSCETQ